MVSEPDVSVIIPVYNGRTTLRQAVSSVLAEVGVKIQVIVADDGSTDGSLDAIADLRVERIRIEHQGQSAAQNAALLKVRAPYVTFLDSDDLLVPGGIHWRWQIMQQGLPWPVVGGMPAGLLDQLGGKTRVFPLPADASDGFCGLLTLEHFQRGHFFPTGAPFFLFEKKLLDRVGRFDVALQRAQDRDLLFRVLQKTAIPILLAPIFWRRLHSQNVSLSQQQGQIHLKPETQAAIAAVHRRYDLGWPGPRQLFWEEGFDFP